MAEKVALTIDVTPDERQRIEELAKARGYEDAGAYLRALAEADAEAFDQGYFWTEEWQAAERKVDEEVAAGEYEDFATMDEFLTDLMSDVGAFN